MNIFKTRNQQTQIGATWIGMLTERANRRTPTYEMQQREYRIAREQSFLLAGNAPSVAVQPAVENNDNELGHIRNELDALPLQPQFAL